MSKCPNHDIVYGSAESIMTALEARAKAYYEGDTSRHALHDSLTAIVYDGISFTYYEGYSGGGQMRQCTRIEATEVIEAYGIIEEPVE